MNSAGVLKNFDIQCVVIIIQYDVPVVRAVNFYMSLILLFFLSPPLLSVSFISIYLCLYLTEMGIFHYCSHIVYVHVLDACFLVCACIIAY